MKVEVLFFIPFLWFLLLVSFIGNLFVLVIILRSKSLRRKPSIIYIINGAASNLLFVAIIGVSVMFLVLNTDISSNWYCSIYDSYFYLNAFIITSTITVIALDKYFAIFKPFYYRQHSTTRNALIITIISWFIAGFFSTPKFITVFSEHGSRLCQRDLMTVRRTIELVSEIIHLVLVFLIPIIVTFVVYGRLVHRLWFSNQDSQRTDIALLKSRRKLTKLSITVTILFLLCWVPHTVETIWWCLGFERRYIVELLKLYASLFVFLYSAISPVIYTFYNEATLQAARRMICCSVCCKGSGLNSRNIQVTPVENGVLRLDVRQAEIAES
ncbi:galanin receptor type 2-like [Actinia tenebrosa]|uniref:Galanin receptor type 2-like n=1 Tax=Actinia tenebrosa TaxID=6105 RepID=A0A6P8IEN7_ACTTE|nr:galanin receptor type 2-like [Actinia tenebrosa]